MARGKSSLGNAGLILALVGGILLIIFGVLSIASYFVSSFNDLLNQVQLYSLYTGSERLLVGGIIAFVIGVVVVYVWKEGKVGAGDSLLIWGIVFIILGLVGGSLGGLLVILGGILLILDFLL